MLYLSDIDYSQTASMELMSEHSRISKHMRLCQVMVLKCLREIIYSLIIDANSIYAFIWILRTFNHAFDFAYVCTQVWLLKKCLNILNVLVTLDLPQLKKKNIHAVNRLNMAACTLMYPLRLFFGGMGGGGGRRRHQIPPPPI